MNTLNYANVASIFVFMISGCGSDNPFLIGDPSQPGEMQMPDIIELEISREPHIKHVVADFLIEPNNTLLTITGTNLSYNNSEPTVQVPGYGTLQVISFSNDEVIVRLRNVAINDGDYRLLVITSDWPALYDTYDLTIEQPEDKTIFQRKIANDRDFVCCPDRDFVVVGGGATCKIGFALLYSRPAKGNCWPLNLDGWRAFCIDLTNTFQGAYPEAVHVICAKTGD